MTWLRSCVLGGVVLFAGLGMRPAFGAIVTVEVEGVVDSVRLGVGMALDGSVQIGSTMMGSFVYDMDAPDEIAYPTTGRYELISASMSIGNYAFNPQGTNNDGPYFEIGVVDPTYWVRCPVARFEGTVFLNGIPRTYYDLSWSINEFIVMRLWTGSSGYISTDALPDSFPDVSVFDLRNRFDVGFRDYEDQFFGISGHLTSLTATHIPEPSIIVLLGLGSLVVLKRK
ncbi:MAG: PEP-CTERM sorting domain-containing protein [Phycisphaerales bacterium]|nr:MAG: PEP-CTERM sorting domain-containing protein [Phycisphaerales bacterium]